MSDVEGLRNLIGTGLVEFVGSADDRALRALRAAANQRGDDRPSHFRILHRFRRGAEQRVRAPFARSIARVRKLNAEVTGRLTESLAGVRVVKGYRAEDREEKVFAGGVQRLLDNILKTLTATSLMSLASTMLLGVVGALILFMGARRIIAGTMTVGTFFTYVAFLALLVAPIFQIVSIGTQLTEGMAGLERTSEILREKHRRRRSRAHHSDAARSRGEVVFDNVSFAYDPGKSGAARRQLRFAARHASPRSSARQAPANPRSSA